MLGLNQVTDAGPRAFGPGSTATGRTARQRHEDDLKASPKVVVLVAEAGTLFPFRSRGRAAGDVRALLEAAVTEVVPAMAPWAGSGLSHAGRVVERARGGAKARGGRYPSVKPPEVATIVGLSAGTTPSIRLVPGGARLNRQRLPTPERGKSMCQGRFATGSNQ